MTKAPTTKSDIDEEEMMLLKKKIAEMEDDISKYHINVRSPIELIKDFLKTLINEDGEDILEKKYIFLKKHYLDLYKEHQQKYRYE